jgi:hypothetical protein
MLSVSTPMITMPTGVVALLGALLCIRSPHRLRCDNLDRFGLDDDDVLRRYRLVGVVVELRFISIWFRYLWWQVLVFFLICFVYLDVLLREFSHHIVLT